MPTAVSLSTLDALEDEIATLSAQITAATYRLLVCIRDFDRLEGWAAQGARSCAHWLNWRVGLDLGAAREKVRVAHALEELPLVSEASPTSCAPTSSTSYGACTATGTRTACW